MRGVEGGEGPPRHAAAWGSDLAVSIWRSGGVVNVDPAVSLTRWNHGDDDDDTTAAIGRHRHHRKKRSHAEVEDISTVRGEEETTTPAVMTFVEYAKSPHEEEKFVKAIHSLPPYCRPNNNRAFTAEEHLGWPTITTTTTAPTDNYYENDEESFEDVKRVEALLKESDAFPIGELPEFTAEGEIVDCSTFTEKDYYFSSNEINNNNNDEEEPDAFVYPIPLFHDDNDRSLSLDGYHSIHGNNNSYHHHDHHPHDRYHPSQNHGYARERPHEGHFLNDCFRDGHVKGIEMFQVQRRFHPVSDVDDPEDALHRDVRIKREEEDATDFTDTSDHTDSVAALRRLREAHKHDIPRCGKKEKHLEHAFTEFGELLRIATEATRGARAIPDTRRLDREWQRLRHAAQCFPRRSPHEAAREIVESRQKRRKLKRGSGKSQAPPPREQQPCYRPIEPYHIVLGDHSTRSRTFGTVVLRFFCLLAKHMGEPVDRVLSRTRNLLQATFPSSQSAGGGGGCREQQQQREEEVGSILYMAGKTSHRFVDSAETLPMYAFGGEDDDLSSNNNYNNNNNRTTFVRVARHLESDVVKHLYTRMTPYNERSLSEVTAAYRTVLRSSPFQQQQQQANKMMTHQPTDDGKKWQTFRELLDFCDRAESLGLTQTAINGLRESLDNQWAELNG